jgi:hypothetical protein
MPLVTDSAINALLPGVSVVITHGIEQGGRPFIPNMFACTPPAPLRVTVAGLTTVTVINDDPQDSYTGSLRCVCLHSIQAPTGLSAVGQSLSIRGVGAADKTSIVTSLTKHAGTCMMNRIRLLGAPGAIVPGDIVRIGADTYEFNNTSPPDPVNGGAGGGAAVAGRILVFHGANSADSRLNFIDAVNGVVDATRIWRLAQWPTGANNTELVRALAGVTLGDVIVESAVAVGTGGAGAARAASAVATATTNVPTTATDIWDAANMYNGVALAQKSFGYATITLNADEILKGNLQIEFPFTPTKWLLINRLRPNVEAVAIVGNAISLTLAGGGAPNNVAGDVLDLLAFG